MKQAAEDRSRFFTLDSKFKMIKQQLEFLEKVVYSKDGEEFDSDVFKKIYSTINNV